MCVGATWMERVEAGCLSLPRNSAILVFSFPLGSSALGLSPRACCSLSPFPTSNLAFALSSLGFLLLLQRGWEGSGTLGKCPDEAAPPPSFVGGGVAVHKTGSAGV